MDRKIKLLYIEEVSAFGGSTVCLYKLIDNLPDNKYNIAIIRYHNDTNLDSQYLGKIKTYNATKWFNNFVGKLKRNNKGIAKWLAQILIYIDWIHRICMTLLVIMREKPDVVHTNNGLGINFPSIVAAKIAKVPVVCHLRGCEEMHRSQRLAYSLADKVIIASKTIANSIGLLSNIDKAVMIYDGLTEGELRLVDAKNGDSELQIDDNGYPLVGIVGMLTEWKGTHVFIEAINALKEELPRVKGFVVGDSITHDDTYKQHLVKLCQYYNISDRIIFTGLRTDIFDFYRLFDIVVHASVLPEPFGRVIIEAMAAGRALVASASGGPTEIIVDGETGVLVPPGDPTALAAAIKRLANDNALRNTLGSNARKYVELHFRQEETVKNIERTYAEILGRY